MKGPPKSFKGRSPVIFPQIKEVTTFCVLLVHGVHDPYVLHVHDPPGGGIRKSDGNRGKGRNTGNHNQDSNNHDKDTRR